MIYYFSAPSSGARNLRTIFETLEVKSFLLSYMVDAKKGWQDYYNPDVPLIIDSGAFTAWNTGKAVDLDEYLEFCKTLPEDVVFINLDVIPETGSSQADVDKCCKQGYKNFKYLRKHLQHVMPVYHYKDDIKWLHKYSKKAPYVGISPANDTHENIKQKFLDYVFANLDWRQTKTHALGYTPPFGMRKYPFYSVDSTSWKVSVRWSQYVQYLGNCDYQLDHIKNVVKMYKGLSYRKDEPLSRDLIECGLIESIAGIEDLMRDLTAYHSVKDFSYLTAQKTLF